MSYTSGTSYSRAPRTRRRSSSAGTRRTRNDVPLQGEAAEYLLPSTRMTKVGQDYCACYADTAEKQFYELLNGGELDGAIDGADGYGNVHPPPEDLACREQADVYRRSPDCYFHFDYDNLADGALLGLLYKAGLLKAEYLDTFANWYHKSPQSRQQYDGGNILSASSRANVINDLKAYASQLHTHRGSTTYAQPTRRTRTTTLR
jgi:hypothetical protein